MTNLAIDLSDQETNIMHADLREEALSHPWKFLYWVSTKDEHDPLNPIKRFPRKELYRYLLCEFRKPENNIIGLPKSRQVMMTWICCAFLLWHTKAYPFQLCFVQSKKLSDAAKLVYDGGINNNMDSARISFMEAHLPNWLQDYPESSYATLRYPNGSIIEGIPEGGPMIRSRTPSKVFSDEAGYQPEFADAYTSMMPLVKNGGQLIAASSAEPGAFEVLTDVF